jgi:hypothetical protein
VVTAVITRTHCVCYNPIIVCILYLLTTYPLGSITTLSLNYLQYCTPQPGTTPSSDQKGPRKVNQREVMVCCPIPYTLTWTHFHYLILHDLITLIIQREEKKLSESSSCSLLQWFTDNITYNLEYMVNNTLFQVSLVHINNILEWRITKHTVGKQNYISLFKLELHANHHHDEFNFKWDVKLSNYGCKNKTFHF